MEQPSGGFEAMYAESAAGEDSRIGGRLVPSGTASVKCRRCRAEPSEPFRLSTALRSRRHRRTGDRSQPEQTLRTLLQADSDQKSHIRNGDFATRAGTTDRAALRSSPEPFFPPLDPPRTRQRLLIRLGHPRHNRQARLVLDIRESLMQHAQVREEEVRRPERVERRRRFGIQRRRDPHRDRAPRRWRWR